MHGYNECTLMLENSSPVGLFVANHNFFYVSSYAEDLRPISSELSTKRFMLETILALIISMPNKRRKLEAICSLRYAVNLLTMLIVSWNAAFNSYQKQISFLEKCFSYKKKKGKWSVRSQQETLLKESEPSFKNWLARCT